MGSQLTKQREKRSAKQKQVDAMSRVELLRLLLNQAQFNGFEFRRWFQANIRPVWPGAEQALAVLASEGRYFALFFSEEFAQSFWRAGALISFSVPSVTYPRVNGRGEVVQVTRKPFTRRTVKPDVWKYHLRQMASSGDPVAYLCRFLPAQDQARAASEINLRTAAQA